MFSVKTIRSFVKASGVRSILQTKPQALKGLNVAELKFAGNLRSDVVQCSQNLQNGIIKRLETAAERKDFREILAGIKQMPKGAEQDSLLKKYFEKYSSYSKDPIRSNIKMQYKPTFEERFNVVTLPNERIRILPRQGMIQINGREVPQLELPQYLYHVTSEANMNLIKQSNTLRRSTNEQLQGVYLFDKNNFLTCYKNVNNGAKSLDLVQTLFTHAGRSNGKSSNLVLIKIPTESLMKSGKLRFRTQEQFFYYQNKILELQKGLKQKFSLRLLADDNNRKVFEQNVLKNKLMTKPEFDKFMREMENSIHQGYTVDNVRKFETSNAIEYVYNKDICPDVVTGIKCRKFSLDDYVDPTSKKVIVEKLHKLF